MLLICPACSTSYRVADTALGPDGRKVKCHKCDHVWWVKPAISGQASPAAPEPAAATARAPAAAPVPPVADETLAAAGGADDPDATIDDQDDGFDQIEAEVATDPEIEALRDVLSGTPLAAGVGTNPEPDGARAAPARRRRHRYRPRLPAGLRALAASRPLRMVALAASLAVVAGGAFAFRDGVVSLLPGSARLYAALGQPVNLRGLEFHNVSYATEIENGLPVLSVRGEVVNITDRTIAIPEIGYSLRNGRMQELYFWTGKATRREVAPSDRVSFITRLAAPPVDAEHVQIRFLRDDRTSGRRS